MGSITARQPIAVGRRHRQVITQGLGMEPGRGLPDCLAAPICGNRRPDSDTRTTPGARPEVLAIVDNLGAARGALGTILPTRYLACPLAWRLGARALLESALLRPPIKGGQRRCLDRSSAILNGVFDGPEPGAANVLLRSPTSWVSTSNGDRCASAYNRGHRHGEQRGLGRQASRGLSKRQRAKGGRRSPPLGLGLCPNLMELRRNSY